MTGATTATDDDGTPAVPAGRGGGETAATPPQAADVYDLHSHLGFYADPEAAVRKLAQLGVHALCATVTPEEYERVASGLDDDPDARVGVGLHPWWLADGRCGEADAARAAELAASSRYVAEVGLDFSHGRDACADAQVSALDAILDACAGGGHVLSLHAVASATAVLDLLERHGTCARNDVVIHWFSGSGDELARARRMGCLFSVNAFGLETRRGRAYVRQIPANQLLLETDLPGEGAHALAWPPERLAARLRETLALVCELRGEDVAETIAATSRRLLGLD